MDFHMLHYSTDQFIDSKRPSESSPFFKVVNTGTINLKEKTVQFLEGEEIGDDFDILEATPYFMKGNKYFIMVDNKGRIINLKDGKEIRNIFRLETSKITSIERHNLSILFSTENNLGFLKIFEQISDQVFCEIGTAKIIDVAGDYLKPSALYAITQETEGNSTNNYLVIFEIKASKQRSSTDE